MLCILHGHVSKECHFGQSARLYDEALIRREEEKSLRSTAFVYFEFQAILLPCVMKRWLRDPVCFAHCTKRYWAVFRQEWALKLRHEVMDKVVENCSLHSGSYIGIFFRCNYSWKDRRIFKSKNRSITNLLRPIALRVWGKTRMHTTCTLAIDSFIVHHVAIAIVCFAGLAPKETRWICIETALKIVSIQPKVTPIWTHMTALVFGAAVFSSEIIWRNLPSMLRWLRKRCCTWILTVYA